MRTAIKKTAAKPAAKMKTGGTMKKMQNGGSNRDPLSGKGSCRSGKCGPMAGINQNKIGRKKSASARAFSKPKLKRTKF